jgi:hypothetical protein
VRVKSEKSTYSFSSVYKKIVSSKVLLLTIFYIKNDSFGGVSVQLSYSLLTFHDSLKKELYFLHVLCDDYDLLTVYFSFDVFSIFVV